MPAYQQRYYSTVMMFTIADGLHAMANRVRVAAKALQDCLEKRRRKAIALDEFAAMSDRSLRDIGLCRAEISRLAWGERNRSSALPSAML